MLAPGPLLFSLYGVLARHDVIVRLGLFGAKKDIANMVASFAYTMLGFLAAIVTILFAFTNTANYAAYRRNGYLDIFFWGYFLSIVGLLFTAFLSLYGYSEVKNTLAFDVLMMSFVDNLVQIFIVTLVIANIARRSFDAQS